MLQRIGALFYLVFVLAGCGLEQVVTDKRTQEQRDAEFEAFLAGQVCDAP